MQLTIRDRAQVLSISAEDATQDEREDIAGKVVLHCASLRAEAELELDSDSKVRFLINSIGKHITAVQGIQASLVATLEEWHEPIAAATTLVA